MVGSQLGLHMTANDKVSRRETTLPEKRPI